MPNTRGKGQKLIPVPADEKFIRELNAGFRLAGYSNRSQFIRDAIVEKFSRLGIIVPREPSVAATRQRNGDGPRPNVGGNGGSGKTGSVKAVKKPVTRRRSKR